MANLLISMCKKQADKWTCCDLLTVVCQHISQTVCLSCIGNGGGGGGALVHCRLMKIG